jgi:glutamate synthase (NADPH/NADH) large chain
VVGTITSGEITKQARRQGPARGHDRFKFKGSAGQSFGAFMTRGMTFSIEGDANDYFGKGLSGGKIIIYPSREVHLQGRGEHDHRQRGLLRRHAGEAYIRGMAGERFGVRNSGVSAVVEGIGDNGCEYMTGGHVVVLGRAGRNFGAGMSGGIGYVLDEAGDFARRVNPQMVGIEKLDRRQGDRLVKAMIEKHLDYTKSEKAKAILANWDAFVPKFVKVMPKDYKRMLACIERAQARASPATRRSWPPSRKTPATSRASAETDTRDQL